MNFCTWEFVLFVVVLSALYFAVKVEKRWIVLLVGSIVFYALCGFEYLLYAVVVSLIFFAAANRIDQINALQSKLDKVKDKEECGILQVKSKKVLVATIILVIGNLVFHKYWNLLGGLVSNLNAYFGESGEVSWMNIALPLGLSYYTFSGLGYVLDVYWKRYSSSKNYAKFFLYIIFFPHIIQGPIERYQKLGHQFFEYEKLQFDCLRIKQAVLLISYGYFKKLFVADRIGILVNGIMAKPNIAAGSLQLLALLFSGIWLYADFSSYMDIARGVSEIFGIQINQNFNHPLFAKSVPEWWRRWHMSLSSWWRDYIYMPLATSYGFISRCAKVGTKCGKRVGKFVQNAVPLLLIWTTTGLWHGTGMPYLAWGIYFSILFILSVTFPGLRIRTENKVWHVFQMVRTYLLFCVGRWLTVPGSLTYSADIVKNIWVNFQLKTLFLPNTYTWYGTYLGDVLFMLVGVLILLRVDYVEEKTGKTVGQMILEKKWFVRGFIYALTCLAIVLFGIYGADYSSNGFAYQNF